MISLCSFIKGLFSFLVDGDNHGYFSAFLISSYSQEV